jgi:hypothetical protein
MEFSSKAMMGDTRLSWTLLSQSISNHSKLKHPDEDPSVRSKSIKSMPALMRRRNNEEVDGLAYLHIYVFDVDVLIGPNSYLNVRAKLISIGILDEFNLTKPLFLIQS